MSSPPFEPPGAAAPGHAAHDPAACEHRCSTPANGTPVFAVCGEALMDVFAAGATDDGVRLDARVGGSPFNISVALARLGQAAAFVGGVSNDLFGERLLRRLAQEGVDVSAVQRLDAPTTLSVVGVDKHGVPRYAFHGQGAADRLFGEQQPAQLPAGVRVLQLASYAMVVDPVCRHLHALVERERGRCLVAYDPNVRLNVEPRVERWRDVLAWMLPRTQLLKVSEEDLGLLYPERTLEALAEHFLAQGVALVVVTRGAKGARAWNAQGAAQVRSEPVMLVDTVGAGDTFQAALLTWLAEHQLLQAAALRSLNRAALEDALRFAGHAAAINCTRRGADPPRRAELGL